MKNMWNKQLTPLQVIEPKTIVEEQCKNLLTSTDGMVRAKIALYDGPISSYVIPGSRGFADMMLALNGSPAEEVDIQEDLGDLGSSDFRYEFFITSIAAPKYKYRVMFLKHGISYFPVRLVLDEDIAKELGHKSQSFDLKSQDDFEAELEKILNSEKVTTVIRSLLSIAQKSQIVSVETVEPKQIETGS